MKPRIDWACGRGCCPPLTAARFGSAAAACENRARAETLWSAARSVAWAESALKKQLAVSKATSSAEGARVLCEVQSQQDRHGPVTGMVGRNCT